MGVRSLRISNEDFALTITAAGQQATPEANVVPLFPANAVPDLSDVPGADIIRHSLEEMKAEDVVEIDLRGRSALADVMIIATGRVARHVAAIAERVGKDLRDAGLGTARVEGEPVCDWVLIDTGDVIVHLFRPEVRAFYNLEKIWSRGRPEEGRPDESKPAEVRPS